ncbi:MAG TPA: purine-nucleoside phosphorylase [Streptosporangiaceae bacterium]|nr:purine-nucleoside phosphorylase [Streptosporangiaceae bacterium]
MSADPFAAAAASAEALAQRTGHAKYDVAVVLGSGWAPAADAIGAADAEVPLAELGGFPEPAVPGHVPAVRSVAVGGRRVLVYLGRVHLYEGHPPASVVHGVRTAIAAGCSTIVLTNAAGGIRSGLRPGQPVLISDHLNLTGKSPLTGLPPGGPVLAGSASPFTDLSDLYAGRLRAIARAAEPGLAEGVYAALQGPQYETPAEIRMLRTAGADLVGMSTALEAIAARHLGAEVLGISLVTNVAAGLSDQKLDHADVLAQARQAAANIGALLAAILPQVG